jgi:hypothetical protein
VGSSATGAPRRRLSSLGAWQSHLKSAPPPAFPNGPTRGPCPRETSEASAYPSESACPDCAMPCSAWLRAAAVGCRAALGTPPSPRANSGRPRGCEDTPGVLSGLRSGKCFCFTDPPWTRMRGWYKSRCPPATTET